MKMTEDLKTYLELLLSNENVKQEGSLFNSVPGEVSTKCCAVGLLNLASEHELLDRDNTGLDFYRRMRLAEQNDDGYSFGAIAQMLLKSAQDE